MRLLDTLMKKRDYHLDMARKFQDLIAVMQGDQDFAKHTHSRTMSIMDEALAQHSQANGNGNGNGNGHTPTKKPNHMRSAKFRKAQGLRMKKLWKEKRAMMLRVTRAAQRKSAASRKAKNAAAREATT